MMSDQGKCWTKEWQAETSTHFHINNSLGHHYDEDDKDEDDDYYDDEDEDEDDDMVFL